MYGAFAQLLLSVLSIAATTLGLLIIAVFFEVGIGEANAWWQWILGLGLAAGFAALGLALIFGAMMQTVAMTAAGWLGMMTGRVPWGFAPHQGNLGRGVGDLALFGLSSWLGFRLYRAGATGVEANWAIEGLFLMGAGVAFGLVASVPRFYFAFRARGAEVEPKPEKGRKRGKRGKRGKHAKQDERKQERGGRLEDVDSGIDVAVLFTAGLAGIALSMCTANVVATARVRDGVATLPYADWVEGCVDPSQTLSECSERAELTLIPRHQTRLRIEYLGSCDIEILGPDGAPPVGLGYEAMKKLGIESGDGNDERRRLILDPPPGARYQFRITSPKRESCRYNVRYLDEPTGPAPEVDQ